MPPIPPDQRSPYGISAASPRRFLSRKKQAGRYGKSTKTIKRWGEDPAMGMPPEYDFNGKLHRDEAELEVWERSCISVMADPPASHKDGKPGPRASTMRAARRGTSELNTTE